jgi:hypothetical protein
MAHVAGYICLSPLMELSSSLIPEVSYMDNQMIYTFPQLAILKDKIITIRSTVASAFHV